MIALRNTWAFRIVSVFKSLVSEVDPVYNLSYMIVLMAIPVKKNYVLHTLVHIAAIGNAVSWHVGR